MTRQIPLTQGKYALVDDQDFVELSKVRWCIHTSGRLLYACHAMPRKHGGLVHMHRVILNAKAGEYVDHINGDGLDNRRCNLRIATRVQNQWNHCDRSRTRGVRRSRKSGLYLAFYLDHGHEHRIGIYKTETEAAKAYNDTISRIRGQFAVLNPNAADAACPIPKRTVWHMSRKRRGSSPYRGVSYLKANRKWVAMLHSRGIRDNPYIGSFDTAEEAARAYDSVAIQVYGENAQLNRV